MFKFEIMPLMKIIGCVRKQSADDSLVVQRLCSSALHSTDELEQLCNESIVSFVKALSQYLLSRLRKVRKPQSG